MDDIAWQHKIEQWEWNDQADTDKIGPFARNRLATKLDALSEGGWELVQYGASAIGTASHFWTLWKRRRTASE